MEPWEIFWTRVLKDHSGELLILTITILVLLTLMIILPQLLRSTLRKAELRNQERLKSLERDLPLPNDDDRSRVAGRTAVVVPSIVMVTAGVVTSILVVYKSENIFAVALAIWVVAGVVSLAAITGGVALIGQMARLQAGEDEESDEEEPEESGFLK